jgi:hypothetical protein
MNIRRSLLRAAAISILAISISSISLASSTEEIGSVDLSRISTPDKVETSIGTLEYIDGAPLPDTADKIYDYLDTMRGVDAFLKGIPGASIQGMMEGPRVLGQRTSNQVVIFEKLADANSLYLTTNTSTMYLFGMLDLKVDGPTVVDVPPGMLGAFQDAWFRYAGDIGPFGQDKGKGGKYLVLPPAYEGEVPDGYFIIKSKTYKMMAFTRGSIAEGLDVALANAEKTTIYPLSKKDSPPKMEFIYASGKKFNTVHTNDYTFYEHLNKIIQYEPLDMLDVETRGLFASIGIEKGKPFAPDARMKKILVDAVAIGNAAARSILWYPRIEGNMKGIELYPGDDSAWLMGWVDKNVFFTGKDEHTMNSDARVMFHYPYTIVTPAMAVTIPGKGSDYGIAYVDSKKQPFDGSKTYNLHLPPNPPANDFWAMTLYDPQTRAPFASNQPKPTVGSQTDGIKVNKDGSYDIYYGPKPPKGFENNWLETIPGKSWFTVIRMYGPEEPWIKKEWRPSEIELVK